MEMLSDFLMIILLSDDPLLVLVIGLFLFVGMGMIRSVVFCLGWTVRGWVEGFSIETLFFQQNNEEIWGGGY